MERVTDKHVERACARYNAARGLDRTSIGYLQWADIRGDGHSKRGLWVTINANGGVGSHYGLRGKTKRETLARIDAAIAQGN